MPGALHLLQVPISLLRLGGLECSDKDTRYLEGPQELS